MRNRLVPPLERGRFFDAFSRRHRGRTATVRVIGPKIGSQVEARDLPLAGIVPGTPGGPFAIDILLGAPPPAANVEHRVPHPDEVWVELSDLGSEEALEIRSVDGTQTVVQFAPGPARPIMPVTDSDWP